MGSRLRRVPGLQASRQGLRRVYPQVRGMTKYRKKPVVIEAFQYVCNDEQKTLSYPRWFIAAVTKGDILILAPRSAWGMETIEIKTLEGTMSVSEGDYIIKGLKGEIYPCKPDIFEASYDKVEE